MRNVLLAALAFAAVLTPGVASADAASDRTAAIRLCRAEIAARANVAPETVDLDQASVRGRIVRVDLDLWVNGDLQNIRCDVTRGEQLVIAEITPALQTASAR